MRVKNIILILLVVFNFVGCYAGPYTYEVFEKNRNFAIGDTWVPNTNKEGREIYSEDKYIYKYEGPKNCHYGFLTNRDDKPEKLIRWIILSGKEFCKEQQAYGFQI